MARHRDPSCGVAVSRVLDTSGIKRVRRGSTCCSRRCPKSTAISGCGEAIRRQQFDVIRSLVIARDHPPRSPGAACRGVWRSPAARRGWSRRYGQAGGRHGASPSGSAGVGHYNRSARRSRPASPRSKPCLGERVALCSRRAGRRSPAKNPASCLRESNPGRGGLRSDRATENSRPAAACEPANLPCLAASN